MAWAGDGAVIGTTGRSLRLEAFQAKLNNNEVEGGIRYMGYVQGSGWQSWVSNGGTGGSVGTGCSVGTGLTFGSGSTGADSFFAQAATKEKRIAIKSIQVAVFLISCHPLNY